MLYIDNYLGVSIWCKQNISCESKNRLVKREAMNGKVKRADDRLKSEARGTFLLILLLVVIDIKGKWHALAIILNPHTLHNTIVYRKLNCPANKLPTFMREKCCYLI